MSPLVETRGTTAQTKQYETLKKELHERLIAGMNMSVARSIDPEVLRKELRRGAEGLCASQSQLLSKSERDRLIDELVHESLGLGPLEPLMADASISDILINGPDAVYVERRGVLELTDVRFRDLDHLIGIVQRIASRVGRRIDESNAIVDARLPDGSRLNAVIHPLALDGALVSIRRFAARPLTAADLVSRKAAAPEMLQFLAACIEAKLNVVISGGTGTGKTTLLNMLSRYIPKEERIATIEDAAELQLQQPHVARMETRTANLEGKGEVTARELLRNALRMRPDRIIVGECRGPEAFDMLQAMNTGHEGSLTTIHANDTRDAIHRLEMLIGMAAPELPMWFIHRAIGSAIHIVVQAARLKGGQRKIVQISEVVGVQGETVCMHDVFSFERTGIRDGKAIGRFESTGVRPNCLEQLQAAGLELSPAMFQRRTLETDRFSQVSRVGERS